MSEYTERHVKDEFGDVHPVEDIEGIGEVYADELEAMGIEETWALHEAPTLQVANALDVSPTQVRKWQRMAELIAINGIGPQYAELLVRSGISSIRALAVADPAELTRRVQQTENALEVNIQGNKIGQAHVEQWIEMARGHEAAPSAPDTGADTPRQEVDRKLEAASSSEPGAGPAPDPTEPAEQDADGEDAPGPTRSQKRVVERTLSEDERRRLHELAKPGAEYLEKHWRKHATEDLAQIRDRIDRLDGGESTRRRSKRSTPRTKTVTRGERTPPGLRSRISEAYGPLSHVRLAYSTRNHHVCHVGLRRDGSVKSVILLVGPDGIEEFETVEKTVDELLASRVPGSRTTRADPFGDVHRVTDIEGIGDVYGDDLNALGIETTQELWHANPHRVADELDISPNRVQSWQQMAELIAINGIGPQYAELLTRTGIKTIDQLADADATDIVQRVNQTEDDVIPAIQGNQIGEKRVANWIDAAKNHEPDND